MKLALSTAFAILFFTATANAGEAYPAYTKDKSAWWVSALLLPPVIGLNVVGEAADLPLKGDNLGKLHKATKGIIVHAAKGVCNSTVVVQPCK